MRKVRRISRSSALTRIDVLLAIFVILILAGILWPYPNHRTPAIQTTCVSNLKQTAFGFLIWAQDHNSKFPWQLSTNNGGTMEFASGPTAFKHFAELEEYRIQSRCFICPTDSRKAATNFASFSNTNLSYFVNLDAVSNSPNTVLSGDRFLTSNVPVRAQVLKLSANSVAGWSGGHKTSTGFMGVLSFVDGHAEMSREPLQKRLASSDLSTNRLLLP